MWKLENILYSVQRFDWTIKVKVITKTICTDAQPASVYLQV